MREIFTLANTNVAIEKGVTKIKQIADNGWLHLVFSPD